MLRSLSLEKPVNRLKKYAVRLICIFAISAMFTDTCVGELIKISKCTCPGDIVVYNCHVSGIGFTIWRGTALAECTNSQILLRHSAFGESDGTMGLCNGGAIVGRSLRDMADNSTFNSELTINLTSSTLDLVGRTVECAYQNIDGSNITIIGSSAIQLTDPLPPPTNVQLLSASPQQLTFEWTPVQSNCSTLQYSTVSDCGTCTNSSDSRTTQTSMMCAIAQPTTDETLCRFSVQTVVCGNISGVQSTPLEVTLKVPESPAISDVMFVPHYNASDNKLIELDIEFIEFESFMISSRVDGSALNYTVLYTYSSTNAICDFLIIPASSCVQNVCTVPTLDPVPCSQSFNGGIGSIDIAISATNVLGRGPASLFSIDVVNYLVNVTFESATRVVCSFVDLQGTQMVKSLTCDIIYGLCQQLDSRQKIPGTPISFNTVVIDLPTSIQSGVHCYTVNASNGTFTVLVDGITGRSDLESPSQPNVAAIIIGILLILVIIFGTLLVIVVFVLRSQCHHKNVHETGTDQEKEELMGVIDNEKATARAHIMFDLDDKPNQLVKALEALKDADINIQNLIVGSDKAKSSVRRIYIECTEDLTEAQARKIKGSISTIGRSLCVTCEAKTINYTKSDDTDLHVEIKVPIKHEPGTLLELLISIYSLEDWENINITDITVSHSQCGSFGNVIIKFLSAVTMDWKNKYDKKKSSCHFILSKEETKTEEHTLL